LQEQIRLLVQLQTVDKVVYDLEVEQEAIPKRLADLTIAADKLEKAHVRAFSELEELTRRRKELEAENETIKARIRKAEQRLMGSKSQREYRAANAEIQEGKDSTKSIDDALLDIMERQEAVKKDVDQLKNRLDEVVATTAEERTTLEARSATIGAELERLLKNRDSLCDGVQAPLMKRYNFIRKKRRGIALAPVANGVCGACHMNLPPQQFNELLRQDRIMECPTCRRIIYYDAEAAEALKAEEEAKAEAEKAAKKPAKKKAAKKPAKKAAKKAAPKKAAPKKASAKKAAGK
jgi:predicted  nucleic acid-binding Zn-ribbon protein